MLISVPLAFEYEAISLRAEHLLATQANEAAVTNLIDALIDVAVPVEVHYQWRPQLTDAGDEMVLEATVNGQADAVVTFNRGDYGEAPTGFGIAVLSPCETLREIRT